jgi:hypothetical protein
MIISHIICIWHGTFFRSTHTGEYTEPPKKMTWVTMEPTFPPAPTMPDTMPYDLLEMKGTTPKVAPHACWQKIEKMIIMPIVAPRE